MTFQSQRLLTAALAFSSACVAIDEHGTSNVNIGEQEQEVITYASSQNIATNTTETRYNVATVAVSAVAGTKYRLRSKVQLTGNSQKAYVQAVVYCRDPSNQVIESLTHQQNILTPNGSLTLYPRLIWQAATTGSHT